MTGLPSLGPRGEGWVAIQLVLLLLVFLAGPLVGPAWEGLGALVTSVVGVVLIGAALAMLVAAGSKLGAAISPLPRPREDAAFVQDGIYGRVRHPMYGGLILGSLGWSLLWASVATILMTLVLAVFLGLKSAREEAWLCERYSSYPAYAGRTRRLVPWIL